MSDGTVKALGDNSDGQTSVPSDLKNVIQVSAGKAHNLALLSDGTVRAWGSNNFGQSNVPTGVRDVKKVSAGGTHSLVLFNNGDIKAWGDNTHGQTSVPTFNSGFVKDISAGLSDSLLALSDGSVIAFGDNGFGNKNLTALGKAYNATAVSTGAIHSLALLNDGTVRAWGEEQETRIPADLLVPDPTVPTPTPTVTPGGGSGGGGGGVPIGAIVGGVLGGLAVIAGIVGFLLWRRTKQAKSKETEFEDAKHKELEPPSNTYSAQSVAVPEPVMVSPPLPPPAPSAQQAWQPPAPNVPAQPAPEWQKASPTATFTPESALPRYEAQQPPTVTSSYGAPTTTSSSYASYLPAPSATYNTIPSTTAASIVVTQDFYTPPKPTSASATFNTFGKSGQISGDVRKFGTAMKEFTPRSKDEMELRVGDEVFVELVYSDGWALGSNTYNGFEGFLPADFLTIEGVQGARSGQEIPLPERTVSAGQSLSASRRSY